MKVLGLDGKWHTWTLDHVPLGDETRPRSNLHLEARQILKCTFLAQRIHEEVYLPGSCGLYLDFYLPTLELAVEVHGEEHYKFTQFFHKDIQGFAASKKRDIAKKNWCILNKISIIELPYNRRSEWKQILLRI